MKIVRFRVQRYQCILDSGWVEISGLTAIVGKNESGKTSLLKALHKFNPAAIEPYSIPREWPRGHRGERSESHRVCTVEFALTAEEIESLQEFAADPISFDRVQLSRTYGGALEVHFPEDLFPARIHPEDIDAFCLQVPAPPESLPESLQRVAWENHAEAIRVLRHGVPQELGPLLARQMAAWDAAVAAGAPTDAASAVAYRETYQPRLTQLAETWAKTLTVRQRAQNYLIERLPSFVYMDEYRAFRGTAQLDEIAHRRVHQHLSPEDETFLALLALAELDFEEEYEKAGRKDELSRDERQFDLRDGEATLNERIRHHWGQSRYEVEFRADGYQFMTFVRSLDDRTLLRLEERSRGFQWFFSFDLMLMHESRETLRNCVILLDEPGLHLHPEGQRDLLRRLQEYARENTLVYSTHLPFMIDLASPDRIKIVTETAQGSVCTNDVAAAQPAAKSVLWAALINECAPGRAEADQHLLVGTLEDHWILGELSNVFRRSGKEGLYPEAMMASAGGMRNLPALGTYIAGQGREVVALFDSDRTGQELRAAWQSGWLSKFVGIKATALDLAAATGSPAKEGWMEDLFTDDFYVARVQAVYEKALFAAGVARLVLPPGPRLVARAEAAFAAVGLPFQRRLVAKRVAADLRQMKGTFELPDSTRRLAEALFLAIRAAFTAMTEESTVSPHRAGAEPAPGAAAKSETKLSPSA